MPEIFVRVVDGKKREPNKLKALLVPHVRIRDAEGNAGSGFAFIITADKEDHLVNQVRPKLAAAGLKEAPFPEKPERFKKPFGFVSLPKELTTSAPIWHDGTSTNGRISGEIRFELETLTPLLVGWERGKFGEADAEWPVPPSLPIVGNLNQNKPVLCPLRAPWGNRPVIIPADSLKGLLRHELGALLGAPMERVAERSYSYRPNANFPRKNSYLEPRLALVSDGAVEMRPLDPAKPNGPKIRVPVSLELLPNLIYDRDKEGKMNSYCFDPKMNVRGPYRGGQGAGERLNSAKVLHKTIGIITEQTNITTTVAVEVQDCFLATVRHLINEAGGHFSERHPSDGKMCNAARERILKAGNENIFQSGDLIWVEWDTRKRKIVSLGWHYYYRWAYTDTVRKTGGVRERFGLFPLEAEKNLDDSGAPSELSPVRRLFGYTGDNEGSIGIGTGDHSQLMGRIFINSALEVVGNNDTDDARFLKPTFLKELGMPRPSAVEHYIKQPHHPNPRPSDSASLVTYGDAAGYDAPGELAGRKFYLDRINAVAEDNSANRNNERSTLALEASKPNRKFRFTLRFRDLDAGELAAVLVALCPEQFKDLLEGTHPEGYCSKLGYARPLGWGSVRIGAKAMYFMEEASDKPKLVEKTIDDWLKINHKKPVMQSEWLAVHRRNHPFASDYPDGERNGVRQIYLFHTNLRGEHSRQRRNAK